MRDETLRRILGGLVGAFLGGVVTLALAFFWPVRVWVLLLPPLLGCVVGAAGGDSGARALMRVASWF